MSGKYTITRLSLTKRYPHFDGLRRSRKLCKMRCPDYKVTRHSKYNGSNMVLRRAASCRLSVRLPCICKRTAYSRNSQLTAQNSSVFSRFNLYDKYWFSQKISVFLTTTPEWSCFEPVVGSAMAIQRYHCCLSFNML